MRTTERLRKLKAWLETELCHGREMKTVGDNGNITDIQRQEPRCYIGWQPTRPDQSGDLRIDPISICPGILIMPKGAYVKKPDEKRFDRFANVRRPAELGQELAVDILFSVYEPGVRLPGFVESADSPGGINLSLLREGTEEGLMTLMDWMDDCIQKLLKEKRIPETDLILDEPSMSYSLLTDQSYVVDKRPIYYGFVSAKFDCYADEGISNIDNLLK